MDGWSWAFVVWVVACMGFALWLTGRDRNWMTEQDFNEWKDELDGGTEGTEQDR